MQSFIMHIIWFSIKHFNTNINMRLVLDTYNIQYPDSRVYIYTL